jgi:hypothetical protein
MRIKFKKDYPDPRENRSGVFKSGKEILCDREFGEKAVKEGYAFEFEPVDILAEIKKEEAKEKLKNIRKDGDS